LQEGKIRASVTTWLTTIATFREPLEAHMFCDRLQVEGIPAMIAQECHVSVNWPWSTALGGVKVQVPRSWAREARLVEARCVAGDFKAELVAELGDLDDLKCPVCGSNHFWKRRTLIQALLSLMSLYFVMTPPRNWLYHCETCGAKWKERR
jgi:DNA-directed RNA polymerase subunit RPC12/RpoP